MNPLPCDRRIREKEYSAQFPWRSEWGPQPQRIREYSLYDYTTRHRAGCTPPPGMRLLPTQAFTWCSAQKDTR